MIVNYSRDKFIAQATGYYIPTQFWPLQISSVFYFLYMTFTIITGTFLTNEQPGANTIKLKLFATYKRAKIIWNVCPWQASPA